MSQAIMDPEEVRRFAKELKRFNDDVQVRASALQARFTALGAPRCQHHAVAIQDVEPRRARVDHVQASLAAAGHRDGTVLHRPLERGGLAQHPGLRAAESRGEVDQEDPERERGRSGAGRRGRGSSHRA